MRELTNDEKIYVSSLIKSEKIVKRFFGIVFLMLPAVSLYAYHANTIFLVYYGISAVFGLLLLIASFTVNVNCSINNITGIFHKKISRSRHGRRSNSFFIGKTRVNIPSAWISSLELKKEYTAVIYHGGEGLFAFTPIVLSVSGLPEDLASIPLSEIKSEERKLVKESFNSFLFYSFFIVIPLFLIILSFKLVTNSDKVLNFLNEHSDIFMVFLDYLNTHSYATNLTAFIFKYGYIFIILFCVIIATTIKTSQSGKISKLRKDELLSMSWNTWLRDYSSFLQNEFNPVLKRSAAKDSSAIMAYRKNMEKYNQFQGEFKLYKKTLNGFEKSMFLDEFKNVNRNR